MERLGEAERERDVEGDDRSYDARRVEERRVEERKGEDRRLLRSGEEKR